MYIVGVCVFMFAASLIQWLFYGPLRASQPDGVCTYEEELTVV